MLQTVNNLIEYDKWATSNPEAGVREYARRLNVDLMTLALSEGEAPPKSDPRLDAVLAEQAQQKQYIAQLERNRQAYEQSAIQHQSAQIDGQMGDFLAKHSVVGFEEDFIHEVAVLEKANPNVPLTQILSVAHERAQWANPAARAKLQAQEKQQAEQARIAKAKQDVARSGRSAAVNIGSQANPNAVKTESAAFDAVFAKHQGVFDDGRSNAW